MRGKPIRHGLRAHGRRIIPAHAGQTEATCKDTNAPADHPRACGANRIRRISERMHLGSSPRMRGKPMCCRNDGSGLRIIPAHAGQTSPDRHRTPQEKDHPRACGANTRVASLMRTDYGSSPRMRGKRGLLFRVRHIGRIIPAHAGQTPCSAPSRTAGSDHPRACGANAYLVEHAGLAHGSSPRMRGKLEIISIQGICPRIIPAHAGQTWHVGVFGLVFADHPRACGANANFTIASSERRGSSPRMRGKLLETNCRFRQPRIIPAHAGQTIEQVNKDLQDTDHPRACGANNLTWDTYGAKNGSSPRMRGKPVMSLIRVQDGRIIPAHAGQTGVAYHPKRRTTDHPRACGANMGQWIWGQISGGSSPRMRGKQRFNRFDGVT